MITIKKNNASNNSTDKNKMINLTKGKQQLFN